MALFVATSTAPAAAIAIAITAATSDVRAVAPRASNRTVLTLEPAKPVDVCLEIDVHVPRSAEQISIATQPTGRHEVLSVALRQPPHRKELVMLGTQTRKRIVDLYPTIAAAVAVLVAPLLALSYFAIPDGADELKTGTVSAWADPARDTAGRLLTFASHDRVYATYVQLFTLLFPAVLLV